MQTSQRYSIKKRGLRTALVSRFIAAGICSAAVTAGCASEKGQTPEEMNVKVESGNLQLAITGVSPSGSVYRLRNALFTIRSLSGNYETFASTEEDPESTFLYLELPSGEYSVYLHPGYTVEQLSAGSGVGPSPTSTTSPPPLPTTPDSTDSTLPPTETDETSSGRTGSWPSRQAGARSRKGKAIAPGPSPRAATDEGATTDEPVAVIDHDAGVPPSVDGGSTSGELEVELISENPAYVYVYGYQVSQVRFSFLVNGAVVNTGNGALVIGADFYEGQTGPSGCSVDDAYEPNDFSSPASISTDETLHAFACVSNEDMYVFDAPVPAGEFFQIRVEFDGSAGDVDIELGTAYYEYITGSYGIGDSETVMTVSNGGAYLLHVYNLGPNSVPYSVQFVTDLGSSNSCCEASDMPGCSDPEVFSCVCAIDSACCQSAFDEICVQEAIAECGAQCEQPAPTSTCCEAAPEPGCLDTEVQECVCGIDPTCCTSTFDENCANLAQGQCGASCEGGE